MTQISVKRPLWKECAFRFVSLPLVNPVCVWVLRRCPNVTWRGRIPVKRNSVPADLLGQRGAIQMSHPDKCQVAMELFWNKGTLKRRADQIALESAVKLSKNVQCFLDIGAYTGLFALSAAHTNPALHAYAFEIIDENYRTLTKNIALNALSTRITPFLIGLAEEEGTLRTPRSFEIGLLASSANLNVDYEDGIDVPIRPLDSFDEIKGKKSVIKIDVEGFELDVFKGASQLLRQTQPDIVSEVLVSASQTPEMQAFLSELGYRFYHITDDGLMLCDDIRPSKELRDWVFSTKSKTQLQQAGLIFSH